MISKSRCFSSENVGRFFSAFTQKNVFLQELLIIKCKNFRANSSTDRNFKKQQSKPLTRSHADGQASTSRPFPPNVTLGCSPVQAAPPGGVHAAAAAAGASAPGLQQPNTHWQQSAPQTGQQSWSLPRQGHAHSQVSPPAERLAPQPNTCQMQSLLATAPRLTALMLQTSQVPSETQQGRQVQPTSTRLVSPPLLHQPVVSPRRAMVSFSRQCVNVAMPCLLTRKKSQSVFCYFSI